MDEQIINIATQRLGEAIPDGSRIILFGSQARGDAKRESDLDFLIVEPIVEDELSEMVRLRRVLRGLPIYADVLVIDANDYATWSQVPQTERRSGQGGDRSCLSTPIRQPY